MFAPSHCLNILSFLQNGELNSLTETNCFQTHCLYSVEKPLCSVLNRLFELRSESDIKPFLFFCSHDRNVFIGMSLSGNKLLTLVFLNAHRANTSPSGSSQSKDNKLTLFLFCCTSLGSVFSGTN